jgi:ornithine decarboxylase
MNGAVKKSALADAQGIPPQQELESKVLPRDGRDVSEVATAYFAAKEELDDRPVMFVDTEKVKDKFFEWKEHLPRVQPCYAVKCNPTEGILQTLARLEDGPGFDCASEAEMRKVLGMGVPPECLVYSNPCKQLSGIAFRAGLRRAPHGLRQRGRA